MKDEGRTIVVVVGQARVVVRVVVVERPDGCYRLEHRRKHDDLQNTQQK